jgi:hypothetical protein
MRATKLGSTGPAATADSIANCTTASTACALARSRTYLGGPILMPAAKQWPSIGQATTIPSNTLAEMQGIDKWAQARGLCARLRHANFPALAGRGE